MKKYYIFYEVLNSGLVKEIKLPVLASNEAKWIIKQEYFYPCSSYTHSNIFFIDRQGESITMRIADAEIDSMYVRGVAEDYQLVLEFKSPDGEHHIYRLHDDIRYNYPPFSGPKAFAPKYMEWDRYQPVQELVGYLFKLEKSEIDIFDYMFKTAAELREMTVKYNILKRDTAVAGAAAVTIDTVEITEGMESLEPYTVDTFPSLRKLVLPASMKELQEYSLHNSYGLKEIYCKALIPPVMKCGVWGYNGPCSNLNVYIPKGAAEEYAKAWIYGQEYFTFIEYYEPLV